MNAVTILGPDGCPIQRPKPHGLAGGGISPYDAGDNQSPHMQAWRPYLGSPDGDLNLYRDRIVSRVRDMVRNDGWASGGVTAILDNAIGASFRPVAKPDHRSLKAWSGISAFDAVWADEFGKAVEARYRNWADDPAKYCDVTRNQTISQMMYLAFRHYLVDGDALAVMEYIPERVGPGRAHYATSVHLIDPDRLSNPNNTIDLQKIRGGVEIDDYGAASHYHIRRAHQGDYFTAAQSYIWDRVPRETDWGRPVVIHYYDLERAGQHRGGAGALTSILQRLKMLVKYDEVELDAAIVNAIFSAYVESPYDPAMVEEAMSDGGAAVAHYQEQRAAFHEERKMTLGGVRIPHFFPGEKLSTVNAARPTSNFDVFESAVLRNAAAGMGLSYEQLSRDYSKTNYSSARQSMLEVWKTMSRRRVNFGISFASPIYACFLEEAMERDDLPLPIGAPSFMECRTAYARARWMGPGRGWVDPVKERQGSILGMQSGLSTLESEAAEQGRDWEDDLAQRQIEVRAYREAGVPLPEWAQSLDEDQEKTDQDQDSGQQDSRTGDGKR